MLRGQNRKFPRHLKIIIKRKRYEKIVNVYLKSIFYNKDLPILM